MGPWHGGPLQAWKAKERPEDKDTPDSAVVTQTHREGKKGHQQARQSIKP